jgi:hypothetical protein
MIGYSGSLYRPAFSSRNYHKPNHDIIRTKVSVWNNSVDFTNSKCINMIVVTRDAFKRRLSSTCLHLHCQYFIAKVYINVVIIDILVKTPPPPRHRPHDGHVLQGDTTPTTTLTCPTTKTAITNRHQIA